MRLLCIDNSGCPELEMMREYTLLDTSCPDCGGYILRELKILKAGKNPSIPNWRCPQCFLVYPKTPTNIYVSYKESRFIALDDLHAIEQAEYSEQLQNV